MADQTKINILNQAEQLFASKGYYNTTLRTITARAGVNLAAVNYHFGSKEGLLAAIFDHHLIPLNKTRIKLLEGIKATSRDEGKPPQPETVLRAFIEPTMAFRAATDQRSSFLLLIGQALHDSHGTLRTIFFERVGPVVNLFHELLGLALPDRSSHEVTAMLSYTLGAMSNPLLAHPDSHFPCLADPAVFEQATEGLINFLLYGFQGGGQ